MTAEREVWVGDDPPVTAIEATARTRYRSCTACEFGYCAPLRCYCGHAECSAAESYIEQSAAKPIITTQGRNPHAESWANREDATWLDKL